MSATPTDSGARPLHTTTVRFDWDLWRRLSAQAERMSVPKAALIVAAVREFVVRLEAEAAGPTPADQARARRPSQLLPPARRGFGRF
jgi:hypothetical protein